MVQCLVSGSTTAGSCGLSLTLSLSQANAFRDLAAPTQAHAIAYIEDDELFEVTPRSPESSTLGTRALACDFVTFRAPWHALR